jgi:SEC-C motif-containing protein
MTEQICPCRVGEKTPLSYDACCKPYIEGAPAPTPEALMRSRYTAYALGNVDYLFDTLAPESRHDFDRKSVTRWSHQARWHGLEIVSSEGGAPGDETGLVEFIAHFTLDAERRAHRELSQFRFNKDEQRWQFVEEVQRKSAPIVKGAQPGRNEPCPCGSGKKYKKCCGVAA